VKGINFFDPVDSALLHALQDPRVNIAVSGAPTCWRWSNNSACASLTPASPTARHRCDQAGDGNLPLLPHPNWRSATAALLPCDQSVLIPALI